MINNEEVVCSILVLPCECIAKIAASHFTQEVLDRAKFLKQFSCFSNLQERDLLNLIAEFTQTVRRKDSVLFKEGESVHEVFFIRQGSIDLFAAYTEIVPEGMMETKRCQEKSLTERKSQQSTSANASRIAAQQQPLVLFRFEMN